MEIKKINFERYSYPSICEHCKSTVTLAVFRIVMDSELTEDLTVEALEKVYQKQDLYDPDKVSFTTWVYTVARNYAIDYLRLNKKRYVKLSTDIEKKQIESFTPYDEVISKQNIESIRDAVHKLPAEYQDFIIAYYYDGLSYLEIADRFHITLAGVKTRLFRAKERLRDILMSDTEWYNNLCD